MESEKVLDGASLKMKHEKICEFLREHNLSWLIRLDDDILYIELPREFCKGSREKFVNLLELGGDTLHCKHVIIYFDKARTDRTIVVKTFMFLGFRALSPLNTLMKNIDKNPDQIFMVYEIDGDE